MGVSRRRFLIGSALLFAGPLVAGAPGSRYLSAATDDRGSHYLVGLDANGAIRFRTALPGRAHGISVRPGDRSCLLAARRPGRWLLELSLDDGSVLNRVQAAPGRHFYGHGVLDPAGGLFYASENDYDGERGVIGVYDRRLARVGEFPSHGIGPHELRLMPDGRTLAVANGGILTHPDSGRSKLNLPDMRPNLAYLDREGGQLLDKVELPRELHQLSIRHLDVSPAGRVALAMQYQGPAADAVPLVALHQLGGDLELVRIPEQLRRRLHQYCGSVRYDLSGRWLAVSAPKANRVLFFDVGSGYAGQAEMADGCGIAPTGNIGEFLISGGNGDLGVFEPGQASGKASRREPGLHWDNHMTRVRGAVPAPGAASSNSIECT